MRQVLIYTDEDGKWIAECPSLPSRVSEGETPKPRLTISARPSRHTWRRWRLTGFRYRRRRAKPSDRSVSRPTILLNRSTTIGRKLSNTDRHRLVSRIENEVGAKLKQAAGKDKVLQDDTENWFVVIGGVDLWHTVPEGDLELIEAETEVTNLEATVVCGHWAGQHVDVYRASLKPYLAQKDIFTNMQFAVVGRNARIKNTTTDFRMTKWFEFPYTDEDRNIQRAIDNLDKLGLTDEQIAELAKRRGLVGKE